MKIYFALICLLLTHLSFAAVNNEKTARVSGFAQSFMMGTPIANATITIIETDQKLKTDDKGKFELQYPIGKPITLTLEKFGYKTIQTGTVIVPPEGLTGPYQDISFQVPSIPVYYLLIAGIGASVDANSCHVATTITKFHRTLNDIPQGEPDAEMTITPRVSEKPFYFDIFKNKLLKDKTNPFNRNLTATSEDGGAAYFNLPPRDEPYIISAKKKGVAFTEAKFLCRKGAFINVSPPQGPMVKS